MFRRSGTLYKVLRTFALPSASFLILRWHMPSLEVNRERTSRIVIEPLLIRILRLFINLCVTEKSVC
jgi:hypothetical protein